LEHSDSSGREGGGRSIPGGLCRRAEAHERIPEAAFKQSRGPEYAKTLKSGASQGHEGST